MFDSTRYERLSSEYSEAAAELDEAERTAAAARTAAAIAEAELATQRARADIAHVAMARMLAERDAALSGAERGRGGTLPEGEPARID